MEAKLYYTAPSDESFEDMKRAAMEVWEQYKDDVLYYDEKTGRVRDIKNIRDNFVYIFAMFDINNQQKCVRLLQPETIEDLRVRLLDGGNSPQYLEMIGIPKASGTITPDQV